MKKNTLWVFGIIVLAAIMGLSFTACDNGSTSGGGWNGQDTTNWPADEDSNSRLYFRVTDDKQTMAINTDGRRDDMGNYIPWIFKIRPEGKGTFPVGSWHCAEGPADLNITATTFTRYWDGEPISYNYTISGDYFLLTWR